MKAFLSFTLIFFSLTFSGCLKPNFINTTNSETPNQEEKNSKIHLEEIKTSNSKNYLIILIPPEFFDFKIIQHTDQKQTLNKTHLLNNSLLSINGSFFDENFKPLGLLVSDSKIINQYHTSNLFNGIFTINNLNQPKLYIDENPNLQNITFAIQAGPVLVDENGNNKIKSDSGKYASRTAIGISDSNQIAIIILYQSIVSPNNIETIYQFAETLSNSPEFAHLKLHSILNLDGGPSTSLKYDTILNPELSPIQNIITIQKK